MPPAHVTLRTTCGPTSSRCCEAAPPPSHDSGNRRRQQPELHARKHPEAYVQPQGHIAYVQPEAAKRRDEIVELGENALTLLDGNFRHLRFQQLQHDRPPP